jgi:hypothetical protein
MPYILLIEWANCDKTFESFQFLKDAKDHLKYLQGLDDVEYVELVTIGETVDRWSNPDCCSETDF